jgi:hypothetical protein
MELYLYNRYFILDVRYSGNSWVCGMTRRRRQELSSPPMMTTTMMMMIIIQSDLQKVLVLCV